MADEISLSTVVGGVTPRQLYDAWLNAETHTQITRSTTTVEPHVGGKHTAWDGFIWGEILALEPGRRIALSWMTREIPPGHPPTRLEIRFEPVRGGTRMTVVHTDIPTGQGPRYEAGWRNYYFEPMGPYFAARTRPARVRRAVTQEARLDERGKLVGKPRASSRGSTRGHGKRH